MKGFFYHTLAILVTILSVLFSGITLLISVMGVGFNKSARVVDVKRSAGMSLQDDDPALMENAA